MDIAHYGRRGVIVHALAQYARRCTATKEPRFGLLCIGDSRLCVEFTRICVAQRRSGFGLSLVVFDIVIIPVCGGPDGHAHRREPVLCLFVWHCDGGHCESHRRRSELADGLYHHQFGGRVHVDGAAEA